MSPKRPTGGIRGLRRGQRRDQGRVAGPRTLKSDVLRRIQNDLFGTGASLSTPIVENPAPSAANRTVLYRSALEGWCDALNAGLPALKSLCTTWWFTAVSTVASLAPSFAGPSDPREPRSTFHPEGVSVLPAKYLNRLSVCCSSVAGSQSQR